jgi:isopenicillin-N epimerase
MPPVAENALWGPDWPSVRDRWTLDPTVAFLNHGSFGACPGEVLDRQAALRAEMERQPVQFLARRLPGLWAEARARVSDFLGADPAGLVFVRNATTAISTVLANVPLEPEDEVVTTDHAYPAVLNALRRACDSAGATLAIRPVPLSLPPPDEIASLVTAGLSERTRLVVMDQVASATGALFPVEAVAAACRGLGVPVLVDGAHAPGMLPVDVDALGADYWTGNLHKWVCAPKGAAVLWVGPAHRQRVHPLVTSHGYGQGLLAEFDWLGTDDPTACLASVAAIDFLDRLGWDRVRRHNHELAAYGRREVAEALGTPQPVPDDAFGSMSLVELPDGAADGQPAADALGMRLYAAERIEVVFSFWGGRTFVRLSAQAYNHPAEYERLAAALPGLLTSSAQSGRS